MLKDSVIKEMKTYLHKHRYVKATSYENGMEDGWVILLLDMPEGEDYVNKVFSTESDAEKYITSPLYTREHSGKKYEIIPVMLSILSDDEAEVCSHVVPDYRGFKHEFIELNEDSLLVVDENGAIDVMDKDDFSDFYEIVSEEFQGTEENMFSPCACCYARFGRSYTEDCDNKCEYANILKRVNVVLEQTIRERDKAIELSKSAIEQLKTEREENMEAVEDLRKEIQRSHDLAEERSELIHEIGDLVHEITEKTDKRKKKFFLF